MTIRRGISGLGIFLGLLLLAGCAAPTPKQKPGPTPSPIPIKAEKLAPLPDLSVSAHIPDNGVHYSSDPLIIYVGLTNSEARRTERKNLERETLRKLIKSKKDLDEERRRILLNKLGKREEPAVFSLGSSGRPLRELVIVELLDTAGKLVPGAVNGLAWNRKIPDAVMLDSEVSPGFYFGIEAETLSRLSMGSYTLRAVLDTKGQPGMWSGRVVSRPETFKLQAQPKNIPREETLKREYLRGHFARLDRDFDRVEQSARHMLALDPKSASAYDFLGDVYAARGDQRDAIKSYQQALVFYDEQCSKKRTGDDKATRCEPPIAIYNKLHRLQKAMFK